MIKVTFGEHDRCVDKGTETRYVVRVLTGDFSFLNFDNDIALLRLNDRVPFSDTIRPICLPTVKGKYIIMIKLPNFEIYIERWSYRNAYLKLPN